MNRHEWADGKKAHKPTIEEEMGMDHPWCHAACLSIAEGVAGWEDAVEASLAIKSMKKLRRDYEALQQEVVGMRPQMAVSAQNPTVSPTKYEEALASLFYDGPT